MTVEELIEYLQQYPKDSQAFLQVSTYHTTSHYEYFELQAAGAISSIVPCLRQGPLVPIAFN